MNTYLLTLYIKCNRLCFEMCLRKYGIVYEYLNDTQIYIITTSKKQAEKISKWYCVKELSDSTPFDTGIIIGEAINKSIPSKRTDKLPPDWAWYRIKSNELAQKGFLGQGINVAVLDTGLQPHKYLKFVKNVSFVPGEPPIDRQGHGTKMGGIIASRETEGQFSRGMAPLCNLFNVKIVSGVTTTPEAIVKGIEWCIDQNVNVINLSIGSEGLREDEIDVITQAIQKADERGIIIVASTGNNNMPVVSYPARIKPTLGIGAIDPNNKRWVAKIDGKLYGSNYGIGIDFVAPGAEIGTLGLNNTFTITQGTSAATACVSGLIAQMLSQDPTRTPKQIKDLLKQYALKIGIGDYDYEVGYGLVQAPLD